MKKRTRIIHKFIFFGIILLSIPLLLEASIELILDHSAILRIHRDNFFRDYYIHHDRNIVTLMPECARYDGELGYTLKPGKCRFSNREFNVEYRINSIGVRDDEVSLSSPEIIVMGDSQAMGWGIEQNETFAKRIEKEAGMRTLNAAVASYGTVRELKILRRVNLDRLKYLIIQYCGNDVDENSEYYYQGNVLPIMTKETYEEIRRKHQDEIKYYFMKHSLYVLSRPINKIRETISKLRGPASPPKSPTEETPRNKKSEAELFLNVLMNAPVNLSSVHIIVFEVNGYAQNNSNFVNQLSGLLSHNQNYPEFIRRMTILDLSAQLTADKYFVLDDHLTAEGHRIIARRILETLDMKHNQRQGTD